jgi:hypothetical protein
MAMYPISCMGLFRGLSVFDSVPVEAEIDSRAGRLSMVSPEYVLSDAG